VSDLATDRAHALVVAGIREFVESIDERLDEGRGFWIIGDVGTGKTTLAMLASRHAIEAGRTVAIYSLPKLLYRIRRTFEDASGQDSYASLFERLTSVDLLHVDDLGAEKRSDWVVEQLYSIVNERYEAQRSMIVTINLEAEDRDEHDPVSGCLSRLSRQIGERTISRLVEICGDPLPLFGDDLRWRVA
jgi:DNA replication protein DnaC